MAEFVENIRMVLGTLGYPILEPLLRPPQPALVDTPVGNTSESNSRIELDLTFKVNNLIAFGTLTDEGFVLRKGSQLSSVNTDSAAQRVVKVKQQLVAEGKIVPEGNHLLLNEDILISSSSYAAVMVAGNSRSGPQSWVAADGRTLKAIEDAAVANQ